MTKVQAEEIKTRIDYINRHYAPIKWNFKMYPSERPNDDGNWSVSIVYNYTENEEYGNLKFSQSDLPLG